MGLFVDGLICLFVDLFICLFVDLFICLFVYLLICLFVYLVMLEKRPEEIFPVIRHNPPPKAFPLREYGKNRP